MADCYTVFVRFADKTKALRLAPDGTTTNRRTHAAMIDTREQAEEAVGKCQSYLDEHHPGSKAWAAPF